TPKVKQDIYTAKSKELLCGYTPSERFFAAHRSLGRFSDCEKLQQIDLRIFLPDDILAKVDIASMAHSLEVRSPFLDHKLAEYVFSLPFEYKYKIFRRKRILKSVGRQFFDANFLSRRKKGFGLPIGKWFMSSLKKPLEACLTGAPIFADHNFFDSAFIKQIFDEHQTGRINHAGRLWNLWFLGEWSKLMNKS
ncbi:MAG: hypothetical protein JRI47_07380, partial [Deltaproteobacteria bacterium]|nr:hypothetical protein [Deltaproteobacteria bacterium]